jgi:cytosine/adenosine deaminase-related metal-dependent hydrolase
MLGAFGCISHGKFPELVAAGANVAIGTDAAAISRFLDMVREMYLAACAHKDARADARVMGAHTAMEMATVNGAKALMWDDAIGSLEPGKCADLVLLDMDTLEWFPRPGLNPVANLVYSSGGHRVNSVMIDGNWVMQNRWLRTLDEDELKEMTQQAAREMLVQTGIPEAQRWPVV